MSGTHFRLLRRLLPVYRRGGRLALLFDYDGTLTPIVEQPRLARLDRPTQRVLQRLARQPRVHVGVVSSRALDDLKNMVRIPNVCLAGSTGLEMQVDGEHVVHQDARAAEALIARILEHLGPPIAEFPGAWLENKRLNMTVHYRAVSPDRTEPLVQRVLAELEPYREQVRIEPGPKAAEVTPNLDWSKATAVGYCMRHYGVEAAGTLFAGDGANDAPALDAVAQRGGVAIGIGPDAPSVASYRLASPRSLVQFLRRLHESLGPSGRRRPRSTDRHMALYGRFGRFSPMSSF